MCFDNSKLGHRTLAAYVINERVPQMGDDSAEQQVVVELFHQKSLSTNAVERLENEGMEKLRWGALEGRPT